MRKIVLGAAIFSILLALAAITRAGLAVASDAAVTCRLSSKISEVAEDYIKFTVSKIDIYDKRSVACAGIKAGSEYQIKKDSFLRNSYRQLIFAGQSLVVAGTAGSSMGVDGAVSWESWELESAGGEKIKLPIFFDNEKVSQKVSPENGADKSADIKKKETIFLRFWKWVSNFFR